MIRRTREAGSASDLAKLEAMTREESTEGYASLMQCMQDVGFTTIELVEVKLILSVRQEKTRLSPACKRLLPACKRSLSDHSSLVLCLVMKFEI